MSFILDALKKSENDRQRLKGPALFEVKVAPPRHRWPLWGVALAVLLGVNLAVVGWLLLRTPSAPEAPPAQPVTTPAAAAAPSPPVPVLAPPSPAELQPPSPVVSGADPALMASGAHAGGAPVVPLDQSSDDYAPAVEAEEEPESLVTRATASGLPSYDQIAERETLPELRLDMHVFSAQRQERFVFVNMRRLKEGETMPEGVRVVTITPDGAVMDFRGRQFVLQRQ
jgi:general secretion pathway protein B